MIDARRLAREDWQYKEEQDKFRTSNAVRILSQESLDGTWTEVAGWENSFGVWALPIGGAMQVYLSGVVLPNGSTSSIIIRDIPRQYCPTRNRMYISARDNNLLTIGIQVSTNGIISVSINHNKNATAVYLDGISWFAQT